MKHSGTVLVFALLLNGCAGSGERVVVKTVLPVTSESLFQDGHLLFLQQEYDSADVLLRRSIEMDSTYLPPLRALAAMYYNIFMMSGDDSTAQKAAIRNSCDYYIRAERLGSNDAETYERICEASVLLEDDKTFLTYARKNAEKYPFDRQFHNLGLAYFRVGDYANAIKVLKEATERFTQSPLIGLFYSQLGRSYLEVDRDQTAQRTFERGVIEIGNHISRRLADSPGFLATAEHSALVEEKKRMLLALKKLHTTYRNVEKLRAVNRLLEEAGHDK